MDKAYERINWENEPSVSTPINATNLNRIDSAVDELDNRVISLETKKLSKAETASDIVDVSLDEDTGIFVFTRRNGSTLPFDTKLEKITTNWTFDEETQKIVLTLDDGTKQEIDLSKLIAAYEFWDSETIAFSVNGAGKVTAIVKNGSITEEHLAFDYMAEIKVESAKAESASASASASETASSASAQEAKQYRDEAEQFKDEAKAVANVDIATTEKAGLVKPDGTTITVDEDGTIHANGSQGTIDYEELENKPSINGVELSGNLTTEDLNIVAGNEVLYLTQAEYDALPDSKLTDGVEYRITDVGINDATASNVSYSNASSGIGATTVQQAVDELSDSVSGLTNSLNNYLIKHIHVFPYEIKANASTNFNITENIARNGYTPIGIVGYAVNALWVNVLNLRLLGTAWDCYLKNLSGEDISANLHVEILYIKNI